MVPKTFEPLRFDSIFVFNVLVGQLSLCPRAVRNLQSSSSNNLRQNGLYCYVLRQKEGDWLDASYDCSSSANGFIVQITSQQDQDFIMQFLKEENVREPIWIGLNDIGHEEHFTWNSGIV